MNSQSTSENAAQDHQLHNPDQRLTAELDLRLPVRSFFSDKVDYWASERQTGSVLCSPRVAHTSGGLVSNDGAWRRGVDPWGDPCLPEQQPSGCTHKLRFEKTDCCCFNLHSFVFLFVWRLNLYLYSYFKQKQSASCLYCVLFFEIVCFWNHKKLISYKHSNVSKVRKTLSICISQSSSVKFNSVQCLF